jgi:hypothetical protein
MLVAPLPRGKQMATNYSDPNNGTGIYITPEGKTYVNGTYVQYYGDPLRNPVTVESDTLPYSNGSYTTGNTAPDTTAQDLAYLDDQEGLLRGMLGSAGRTREQGVQQIEDSFNTEKNRSDVDRANAQSGFATKREDTTRDKMGAIGRVNSGARTLADSVRRILGMASGANSTAYKQAAPNAIARDASMKRTGVNDTFGRNFRDLDTAETSTMGNFDRFLEDLTTQKTQKRQGLEEGVLQQEQGVYRDLGEIARQRSLLQGGDYNAVRSATAPAMTAISDRQSALDNLFNQFRTPFNAKPVEVATPNLANYTVDKTAVNAGRTGGGADNYSPYSAFARKKFQQPTV